MRGDELVAERVRGLLDRHDDHSDGPVHADDSIGSAQSHDTDHSSGRDEVDRGTMPSLLSRLRSRVPVRVPVRLDPGHRAALAVGVAVLVAALVTGAWMLASRPRALSVSASSAAIPGAASPVGTGGASPSAAGTSPSSSSSSSSSATGPGVVAADLVVDVAGKVVRPGLYHLPPGARVADAVAAAGGARRGVDLTTVNLAARVSDGQQIVIGVPGGAAGTNTGAVSTGSPPAGSGGAATGGSVDLNTATLEQLETLPGIGPALGQRILDWRAAHGSFASVDQLNDVSGIGDVKFAALKPRVTT